MSGGALVPGGGGGGMGSQGGGQPTNQAGTVGGSGGASGGASGGGGGGGAARSAPKFRFRVVSGFTPDQLGALRQQIAIFKKIKKREFDFPFPGRPLPAGATLPYPPTKAHQGSTPPAQARDTQQAQQQRQAAPVGAAAAAVAAARSGANLDGSMQRMQQEHAQQQRQQAQQQRAAPKTKKNYKQQQQAQQQQTGLGQGPLPPPRPMPANVFTMPDWYHPSKPPIYDVTTPGEATFTHANQFGYKPMPLQCDIRLLLDAEADRQLSARRKRRLVEVQDELRVLEGGGGIGVGVVESEAEAAKGAGSANNRGGGGLASVYQRRRLLQTEERSLRLVALQDAVRAKVIREQRELMSLGERPYRKLVREGEKQRLDMAKDEVKRARREKEENFKSIQMWRRKLGEDASNAKELLTTRNRHVMKLHERMNKDWIRKQRDAAVAAQAAAQAQQGVASNAEYLRRVEALKANDMEAYRQLLAEAKGREGGVPGAGGGAAADDRYDKLQDFLEKTEGYLQQLGGKIAALKLTQQRSEAAAAAAAEAEAAGLTEEEVLEAAEAAAEAAAAAGSRDLLEAAGEDGDSKQKYYALAHSDTEKIIRQPRMLTAGTLRDYQIVSLQWMISLYNNRLNGILADEMGLGKTVQVCALIAYLWESKQNFGPHLIIVPNAVIVNWKSEIKTWLKNVQAVYYVGAREARAKIFKEQIVQLKFNVLVTTYEFVMRDRAKLSKVNWKYIIIDEAQRLKDREGRLSRDLDKFRCQRRLLLTGTPLQNDLSELWSLLNLLLPQVFDNHKIFQEWFGGDDKKGGDGEDELDWMEKEKKIIVISRLHQILEPFMLRRLVQDVERKLPPKVTIVVHCPFSAYQAAVYDWVKRTGTIRVEPNAKMGLAARANFRGYLPLQNRCMELRKLCNHPALNYPREKGGEWRSGVDLVRTCGKLWVLDRLLVKLRAAGHRVLIFSTMTKLLDLLEDYLKWRSKTPVGKGLEWCRIDGTTPLDAREVAITEFNAKESSKFVFLLSIRAAGRGLNLQSADTVIVYDPDPNPKNEEQAVARSHRIGQKREVRCLHLEAVMDEIGAGDDEGGIGSSSGGVHGTAMCDIDDQTWGTGGERKFTESIESMVRNVIQQQKIDMAAEIVDAGRFDQQTTHAERRETLEKLMQESENSGVKTCQAFSMRQLNEKLARSPEEVELFNRLDGEADLWPGTLTSANETPPWIRFLAADRDEAMASNAKVKPGRAGAEEEARKAAAAEAASGIALGRGERSRSTFVPGMYAAADAALTGEDADAVKARRAKAETKTVAAVVKVPDLNAAAAAAANAAASAAAAAAAVDAKVAAVKAKTDTASGTATNLKDEPEEEPVVMGSDTESEMTEHTEDGNIEEIDAGAVDMDDGEDEIDEEDDGMMIGEPIEEDDEGEV